MVGIEQIIKYFSEYTDNFSTIGIIRLVCDILLVLLTIIFVIFLINKKKKIRVGKLTIGIIIIFVAYIISIVCGLFIFRVVILTFAIVAIMMIAQSYSPDVRHFLENTNSNKNYRGGSTNEEKRAMIATICTTASYLSKRKIGALISIERKDSMDEYIQNAIALNAVVTQEIMTTIFTPGTACHDGAIIIRGNIIKCAGAFFPSTLKYDVPKSLGSRHRAAIGISEHVDALTVVVSEQTGNISVTLDGIIYLGITNDSLKEMLESHLLEEK